MTILIKKYKMRDKEKASRISLIPQNLIKQWRKSQSYRRLQK